MTSMHMHDLPERKRFPVVSGSHPPRPSNARECLPADGRSRSRCLPADSRATDGRLA